MFKRIAALTFATLAIFSLGVNPASADPGHQTIGCGVGESSGWDNLYVNLDGGPGGDYYGKACFSIYDHGDHVDVTYWVYDGAADGYDVDGYRDLNWATDGDVKVCSASGSGTYGSVNKQYDDPAGTNRSITMKATADSNGIEVDVDTIATLWF